MMEMGLFRLARLLPKLASCADEARQIEEEEENRVSWLSRSEKLEK